MKNTHSNIIKDQSLYISINFCTIRIDILIIAFLVFDFSHKIVILCSGLNFLKIDDAKHFFS